MRFNTKRGRPLLNHQEKDAGTDELRQKRAKCLTMEPLDLYFKQGLISSDQHWAGIHLRWLYTIRFGSASIRSLDYTATGGAVSSGGDNLQWNEKREREYNTAIRMLDRVHLRKIVMDTCIFNRPFEFSNNDFKLLKEGLGILIHIWYKR